MTVIQTDQWLLNHYDRPQLLCEHLTNYFSGVSSTELHHYLTSHGMYEQPNYSKKEIVQILYDNDVWTCIENEYNQQRNRMNGPQIPIFILPANDQFVLNNRYLNSVSGLAFPDKLFLFVASKFSKQQLKSIFTHEYNHVCRLNKFNKNENDYVLIDTIILEGLAENAVREQYGEENVANWTTFYTEKQLHKIWKKVIYPNVNIPITTKKHEDILYGFPPFPKMAGYCVGYYIVKKYMEENNIKTKALLDVPTSVIMDYFY